MNKGADVNYVHKDMHADQERSTTPLIQASALGHAIVVSVLIERGADVNKPEPCHGFTALHLSDQEECNEIALFLLDNGADVNAKDNLLSLSCCSARPSPSCRSLDHPWS
jgi:ankyrin repeat protein